MKWREECVIWRAVGTSLWEVCVGVLKISVAVGLLCNAGFLDLIADWLRRAKGQFSLWLSSHRVYILPRVTYSIHGTRAECELFTVNLLYCVIGCVHCLEVCICLFVGMQKNWCLLSVWFGWLLSLAFLDRCVFRSNFALMSVKKFKKMLWTVWLYFCKYTVYSLPWNVVDCLRILNVVC